MICQEISHCGMLLQIISPFFFTGTFFISFGRSYLFKNQLSSEFKCWGERFPSEYHPSRSSWPSLLSSWRKKACVIPWSIGFVSLPSKPLTVLTLGYNSTKKRISLLAGALNFLIIFIHFGGAHVFHSVCGTCRNWFSLLVGSGDQT